MGSSAPSFSRLTAFQDQVLLAFFEREQRFFLTGGAALVGYYFGHRTTTDLDLHTLDDRAFERCRHVMADAAASLGVRLEVTQDFPGFQRTVLTRPDDGVVVDLMRQHAYQIYSKKEKRGAIQVDPLDEILANKLTTLVGRMEERDLVDILFMERVGYTVESALSHAFAKNGGCTPAALAWVLSEFQIPDDACLPAGVKPEDLRGFARDLMHRLRTAALPAR